MRQCYSAGETPADVITKACLEQCPAGYPMLIRSKGDWAALAAAWNQGIDSHLEALTERSTADSTTGKVLVHPEELHVLLRRLWEAFYEGEGAVDVDEEEGPAWRLRSDILQTLGIEEV